MAKATLSDTFENLEQIPQQVGKQIAGLPATIITKALKPGASATKTDPLTGIEIPTPQKIKKLQIIAGVSKPQDQNIPAYIAGKPGFSEEKMVKKMQGLETEKKELPAPVSASKPKMGTAERKLGVSG